MAKKIIFHSRDPRLDIQKPLPASRFVPDWYRNLKRVNSRVNTVKTCVPFLDSLTAGYIITLPFDVTWDSKAQTMTHNGKFEINSDHMDKQTEGVNIPQEYNPQPHKWINQWHVKTPKGYSTLFIHPLNRPDLPFYSFSGIVDTDKHPIIVNFPFVLRDDFNGTIPAGTPIIQAIPFKRDDWDSKIIDNREPHHYDKEYEVFDAPFGWYKRKWWSRKKFQ